MHILIVLIVTFTTLLGTSCYGAESLYTWKDDKGTLNITDAPPPEGAEIIDISPVITPPPPKALPVKKVEQKAVTQQTTGTQAVSREKKQLLAEADKYRQQQKKAMKEGEALEAEIEVWQAKLGTKRKRRRNKRKIKAFNERIVVINKEIETADKKASALENKAAAIQ